MILFFNVKVFVFLPKFKSKLVNKPSYFLTNWFFYYIIFLFTIIYPTSKAISFENNIFRASSKYFPILSNEVYCIIAKGEY